MDHIICKTVICVYDNDDIDEGVDEEEEMD